jgi:hypothetical protein
VTEAGGDLTGLWDLVFTMAVGVGFVAFLAVVLGLAVVVTFCGGKITVLILTGPGDLEWLAMDGAFLGETVESEVEVELVSEIALGTGAELVLVDVAGLGCVSLSEPKASCISDRRVAFALDLRISPPTICSVQTS